MTDHAPLTDEGEELPLQPMSLRSRVRCAWAALRGRPVMTGLTFRWSDEYGWQNSGCVMRRGDKPKKFYASTCYFDGSLWEHPWTTQAAVEADLLAISAGTLYFDIDDQGGAA